GTKSSIALAIGSVLVFLLNAGHRRVQRWIEGRMAAEGGLTAAQSGVLFFLGERDGALIDLE
ncbi:hypothetical protein, partial [Serratia marcescens]|uniref:hypothetical protein n=1 Tax=Serratia marcescens TaxID=615 RepID=UPI001953A4FE